MRRRGDSRFRPALTAALAFLAGVALMLAPQPRARAQSIVLDPTNLVQNIIAAVQNITEVAQQVQQLTNEATQIANQIQQLQDMANQASQLGSPSWGQVQAWINNLATAAQIGNSLVYNMPNIAGQLQTQFPGYVSPTNWNTQYQQWSTTTLDTLRGTLQSAGLNISDVNTVDAALQTLRSANDSATGRNELMQVANSLASLQVEEMAKVRQLLALEINAANVWKTNSTNASAASEAALQEFIGAPGAVANPAASGAGFNP
ncbi:MAG: P-type conjugative transfer protein TrbJ [Acidimicrobiia bacterium]|nr:P-type conjugative transfer protein TrbJ [Acidimicrobiia bacterium]